MSVVFPIEGDKRDLVDVHGVLIDDGAIFNMPILQKMLGQTEDSVKKWVNKHDIKCVKGRTWVFTGKMTRKALEAYLEGNSTDAET